MIATSETCIVCGRNHGVGMQCPDTIATAIINRANTRDNIGLSFQPGMSRDEVMARLTAAQAKVLAAAPVLMSDKYKFHGDEIHGPRRPSHEAD